MKHLKLDFSSIIVVIVIVIMIIIIIIAEKIGIELDYWIIG
jgi:hypothetical protein